jgi:hypothetical protein
MARLDEALDDVLGDPVLAVQPHPDPHPHRTPLRWSHERRRGSVPPPPAHCLSPVHPWGGVHPVEHAER